jgi:hypothetical protein
MSPNKTNVHQYGIHPSDEPILVPAEIEHHSLVTTMPALPNAALIVVGRAQSALDASLNRASARHRLIRASQNNRTILREIILILQLIVARSKMGESVRYAQLPTFH